MFTALHLLALTTTLFASAGAPGTGAPDQPAGESIVLDANTPAGRRVLDGRLADVVVRVTGGIACTGTPITGTPFVVTAAHCVLDQRGEIAGGRTVLRGGVEYPAVAVIVDREYHATQSTRLDAAVLVMDQPIPGPSATLGDHFPVDGQLTLAGFQRIDADGSLRPRRGGPVNATALRAVAGCVVAAAAAQVETDRVKVPCGLIPGASGGGAFVERDGQPVLVGIISTVYGTASNGLVPIANLRDLLEHASSNTYAVPAVDITSSTAHVSRS
jgi:hypothetical protein